MVSERARLDARPAQRAGVAVGVLVAVVTVAIALGLLAAGVRVIDWSLHVLGG